MSGGVDSPALASVASRVFRRRGCANGVRAFTTTVEGLDRNEGHYARLVADHLEIPISISTRATAFDPEWTTRRHPHPVACVRRHDAAMPTVDPTKKCCRHSRVCFYGEGPDNALQYEWQPYLQHPTRHASLRASCRRHRQAHQEPSAPSADLPGSAAGAGAARQWTLGSVLSGVARAGIRAAPAAYGSDGTNFRSCRHHQSFTRSGRPRMHRSAGPSGRRCFAASTPRRPDRRWKSGTRTSIFGCCDTFCLSLRCLGVDRSI